MAANCRVCLVLKHFGPYFVRIFVHSFALSVGGGGHLRVSESCRGSRFRSPFIPSQCKNRMCSQKKAFLVEHSGGVFLLRWVFLSARMFHLIALVLAIHPVFYTAEFIPSPKLGCRKKGVRKGAVILRFYVCLRLSAFPWVCVRLSAFSVRDQGA